MVALDAKASEVKAVVHFNVKGEANGTVRLDLPAGWKSQPASAPFATMQDGEDRTLAFTVTPANLGEKSYSITAVAEYRGRDYREGHLITGYPNLRPYFLYAPATYKTSGVNVKVAPGLKIGYVIGSGDEVPDSLIHLGIKVDFLAAADLANGDLSRFDTIPLSIRAGRSGCGSGTPTTRRCWKRRNRPDIARSFQMPLYPWTSIVAFGGWLYILVASGISYILADCALLVFGIAAY